MPRIEQRVIGTSLFLYESVDAANQGKARGGSGFLLGQPCQAPSLAVHLYAVSNAHVAKGGFPVVRVRTRDGSPKVIELGDDEWQRHPRREDVAIARLGFVADDDDQELQWVPRGWLVTEEDIGLVASREEWPWNWGPVVSGEDAFTVTRFIGYDGKERNEPHVRFGNVASTEVVAVHQGRTLLRSQESLLVEARSLAGYSGAPVFVYRQTMAYGGGVPPVAAALLLGIGWGLLRHPEDEGEEFDVAVEMPDRPTPGRYNSGMMLVVPGWKLGELLDDPRVVALRRHEEQMAEVEGTGVELTASDDEFGCFEALTRRLLAVPKSELNERREQN